TLEAGCQHRRRRPTVHAAAATTATTATAAATAAAGVGRLGLPGTVGCRRHATSQRGHHGGSAASQHHATIENGKVNASAHELHEGRARNRSQIICVGFWTPLECWNQVVCSAWQERAAPAGVGQNLRATRLSPRERLGTWR